MEELNKMEVKCNLYKLICITYQNNFENLYVIPCHEINLFIN